MTKPGRIQELTTSQQFVNLKMNPLTAQGSGELSIGRLVWRFEARPSPISRPYALRITYAVNLPPRVFVDGPSLPELAAGRPIPHVYSETPTKLCLFLPARGEWRRDMLIDRTIVPWSVLWLWYFEEWLATGEWQGGGVHPSDLARARAAAGRVAATGSTCEDAP